VNRLKLLTYLSFLGAFLIGMALGLSFWVSISLLQHHPELFKRGPEPTPTYHNLK
jgi:hypothetical protein